MTVHDDDILDFDFLEDDATREQAPRSRPDARRPGGGGPRRPRLRPTGSLTPLLRLVGLIAFAILIVVLLVAWADGCAGDRKRDRYADYMEQIAAVGRNSATIGNRLSELLTTPGLKQAELETKLDGLIQQQELGVTTAAALDPPGPVTSSHEEALESLRFRVSGMRGLLEAFRATKSARDASTAGAQLSAQGDRLTASDVVWSDLFRASAERELAAQEIGGVAVPASTFLGSPDLVTPKSMTAIWQRIHGASTGGQPSGLHGTGLASVTVMPSGQQLSTTTETTIQASTDLGFDVAVRNTGDNQEVSVQVNLTIPSDDQPIRKTQEIDVIDPGETETVTFSDFKEPPFGEKLAIKVDVLPVKGEKNTANNSAEFPVIFTLSSP